MAKLKSGTRIYGTATVDASIAVGSAVTANSSGIQVAGIVTANQLDLTANATANDSVLFQFQNAVSAADFDFSMMAIDGSIKFLKAGAYSIAYGAEAKVSQPIPVPVPSFSFGMWKNGVLIPGSTISGYTQAPGDDTIQVNGQVIIDVSANDVVKLRNASSNGVDMTPNTIGIDFPVTVATMNIHCVKSMM